MHPKVGGKMYIPFTEYYLLVLPIIEHFLIVLRVFSVFLKAKDTLSLWKPVQVC